jgi:hypothetical protein
MNPILAAIEDIESREPGASFSYRAISKKHGCSRATLQRKHAGTTRDHAGDAQQCQNLSPEQELELVRYIQGLSDAGLPPTRAIIRNYGSFLAKKPCSECWVSQFLDRNKDTLTIKFSKGMDRNCHAADQGGKYELYFKLLHSKIQEYNIDARHIYNMDEKGFLIGIIAKSKRVFSKASWERKEVTEALQDGSREWITVLACICADGTSLEPAIIYEGKSGLQSSWVDDVIPGKHPVFLSNSPTGWSNNDIGLAWLQQVFDRCTKPKARTGYRLLILNGHV